MADSSIDDLFGSDSFASSEDLEAMLNGGPDKWDLMVAEADRIRNEPPVQPRRQKGKQAPQPEQHAPAPDPQAADDDGFDISSVLDGFSEVDENGHVHVPEDAEPEQPEDADDDGQEIIEFELSIPDWMSTLESRLKSSVSHAFLLDGNIRDYFTDDIGLIEGMVTSLLNEHDFRTIVLYDRAHGVTFYDDAYGASRREEYKRAFISECKEARQALDIPGGQSIPTDPVELLRIAEWQFNKPIGKDDQRSMLLITDYQDMLTPSAEPAQMRPDEREMAIILSDMCRSQTADAYGSCLIMLCDESIDVNQRLRDTSSRIDRITVPQPDTETRLSFIMKYKDKDEWKLENGRSVFAEDDDEAAYPVTMRDSKEFVDRDTADPQQTGVTIEYLATNTAGLSNMQVENIILSAVASELPISKRLVKDIKNEIIRKDYQEVIEQLDPHGGFASLGGMEKVKDYFKRRVIAPIRNGELETVPMGVLLMGPAGTGKTALAKAVAYESGMNCISLNLNKILDKYVGSSERNLDRALRCAMDMQPTILFIDEIDEALPHRHTQGNNGGVNGRINKRMLEFLSDTSHRGQVVVLAATNYPEKVDTAMIRTGRFDARIPMFAPDMFERMDILRIQAASKGYSFSWMRDPAEQVDNVLVNLRQWMDAGNQPTQGAYLGDVVSYPFKNANGEIEELDMPRVLVSCAGKGRVQWKELIRCIQILLIDSGEITGRSSDVSTGRVESNKAYKRRVRESIYKHEELFGGDPDNLKKAMSAIWEYLTIYAPIIKVTEGMTGAELEGIIGKAASLYSDWYGNPSNQQKLAKQVKIGNTNGEPNDILPGILREACISTSPAIGGVRAMEDYALIYTSDRDFIPDAIYGTDASGNTVSFKARKEELTQRMLQYGANAEDIIKSGGIG